MSRAHDCHWHPGAGNVPQRPTLRHAAPLPVRQQGSIRKSPCLPFADYEVVVLDEAPPRARRRSSDRVPWVPAAELPTTVRIANPGLTRTGETEPGVYQQVWRELAAANPNVVLSVGDTIQGERDAVAESQWREWSNLIDPWRKFRTTPRARQSRRLVGAFSCPVSSLRRPRPALQLRPRSGTHYGAWITAAPTHSPPAELAYLESDLKRMKRNQ